MYVNYSLLRKNKLNQGNKEDYLIELSSWSLMLEVGQDESRQLEQQGFHFVDGY